MNKIKNIKIIVCFAIIIVLIFSNIYTYSKYTQVKKYLDDQLMIYAWDFALLNSANIDILEIKGKSMEQEHLKQLESNYSKMIQDLQEIEVIYHYYGEKDNSAPQFRETLFMQEIDLEDQHLEYDKILKFNKEINEILSKYEVSYKQINNIEENQGYSTDKIVDSWVDIINEFERKLSFY